MGKRWAGVIIPLLLIPILICAGFIWAGWDSNQRLNDEVRAAIVNLDEPVTIDDVYTPLGRQLTAALVDSARTENLRWELSSAEDAKQGLADGTFAAMVIIPEDFSAKATSFAGDAAAAKQAIITIETSPIAGIADAEVGRLVALAAVNTLNNTLTEGYLDQLYLGFNTMKDQYDELADGSQELADGTKKLVDGIADAADGADLLADGADKAAVGIAKAAGGADKLAQGVSDFAGGVNKAAAGTTDLKAGAAQLAKGLDQLANKAKALPTGVNQLADGTTALANGTKLYTDGVNQFLDQLLPLSAFLDDLSPAAEQAANIAQQLNSELKQFVHELDNVETNTVFLDAVADAARQAAAAVDCPVDIQTMGTCPQFEQALGDTAATAAQQALISASKDVSAQLKATDAQGDSVLSVAQDIADIATQLPDQVALLLPELESQADQLAQLRAAGPVLAANSQQLAVGLNGLADQLPALTDGIDQSAKGADQLAKGVTQVVSGLDKAATGGEKLTNGMNTFTNGLGDAARGSQELSNGISDLAGGLSEAAENGPELTDGMQEMADGIAKGKEDIPSYTAPEREKLAEAVASPISTEGMDELADANLGWGSVLLILALWVGTLVSNVVLRQQGQPLLTSNGSTLALCWAELRVGLGVTLAQCAALISIAELVLQFSPVQFASMAALLLLAGLAFELTNYALIRWLGTWGQFLSIAAAVIFSTVALTNASSAFFGVAQGALPLAPILDCFRAIATGADSVSTYFVSATVWLLVAVLASFVYIVKSRSTSLEKLLTTP